MWNESGRSGKKAESAIILSVIWQTDVDKDSKVEFSRYQVQAQRTGDNGATRRQGR